MKRALENAQRLEPNSPETLLALGYYQYRVLRDFGLAKATFHRVGDLLPGSAEIPYALALIARREGEWDQCITYFEAALALDPRNAESLVDTAQTYGNLRKFSAALKLYEKALDVRPNDAALLAAKAGIYRAQGNLQKAAGLHSEINEQSPDEDAIADKITQLRLERNYVEAIRFLQVRQSKFQFRLEQDRAEDQLTLALMQHLAGDTVGTKVNAGLARDTFEQLHIKTPSHYGILISLSKAYALMEQKDLALKIAQRAIDLLPTVKDRVYGPMLEENLAVVQALLGENTPAISALTRLLQAPYYSWYYPPAPITPALLRLDPIWDPLRTDPAFQKLCEEKQP